MWCTVHWGYQRPALDDGYPARNGKQMPGSKESDIGAKFFMGILVTHQGSPHEGRKTNGNDFVKLLHEMILITLISAGARSPHSSFLQIYCV